MRRVLLPLLLALTACEGAIVGERPLSTVTPGGSTAGTPGGPTTPGEVPLPAFQPAPLRVRQLLKAQYQGAVADLLGPEAAAVTTPPDDVPVNGLAAIGAAQLSMPASSVDAYEAGAYLAAQKALAVRHAALVDCTPTSSTDATCMGQLAARFVPRAFRRPATTAELDRYTQLGLAAATAYDDFDKGVEFLFAALLQSPNFLYLVEVGTPDEADATLRRLDAWELASRLSFFITNAPPDDALQASAADGSLLRDEVLRAQAARLARLPAARAAMTGLFDELLDLGGLEHLAKDAQRFPDFDPALGASMHEETRRTLLDTAFDRPADLRELFTRRTSFVDASLARHYGLPSQGSGWQEVTLPATRAGLFTQAAFLALQSHPSQNSPTYRGKFIRERLLCTTIPAPPPDVSTVLPEAPAGTQQTLRQKMQQHMTQGSSCAGCHTLMDPVGFAFEGFDATGREQSTDDGLPVDTSGALDGTDFTGAPGLMQQLHDDPRVISCLGRQVFRQGVGHVDLASEGRPLKAALDAFAASGYRYQTLLVELAASDAFRQGLSRDTP